VVIATAGDTVHTLRAKSRKATLGPSPANRDVSTPSPLSRSTELSNRSQSNERRAANAYWA